MKKSDLKGFVRERLVELLHKETIDSYRVRNHYSLSLMEEFDILLTEWNSNQIKNIATIEASSQELLCSLKSDLCIDFSFYSIPLFEKDIADYVQEVSSKEKKEDTVVLSSRVLHLSARLHHIISKCIEINKEKYLEQLFLLIESIVFSEEELSDDDYPETLSTLDWGLSSLCCTLLHQGYSKNHLYYKASKLNKEPANFKQNFLALKDSLLKRESLDHIIVFRLKVNDDIVKCSEEYGFTSSTDRWSMYLQGKSGITYKSYSESHPGELFFVYEGKALDMYSAIKDGKQLLSYQLDVMNVALSKAKVTVQDRVLAIQLTSTGRYIYEKVTDFQLDGVFANNASLASYFKSVIDDIKQNSSISEEVKDRMVSALRHLRLGNITSELESRFINYWIALEFIFSSPITNENTFGRIKKYLTTILCSCYVRRNVLDLEKKLKKEKVLNDEQTLVLMTNEEWAELIDKASSLLLQWRLCKMKSHLRNHEALKDYIKQHERNLNWHLIRIYRMRNELIHDAAIKQNIEGVTSNLRYYLVFLLNQLLSYFKALPAGASPVDMNDFFIEYETKYAQMCESYDKTDVLSIDFQMSLLQ